jgi:hypothetical protein
MKSTIDLAGRGAGPGWFLANPLHTYKIYENITPHASIQIPTKDITPNAQRFCECTSYGFGQTLEPRLLERRVSILVDFLAEVQIVISSCSFQVKKKVKLAL